MYDIDASAKTCRLVIEAYSLGRYGHGEPDRDALDRAYRSATLAIGAEEARRIDERAAERVGIANASHGDPRGGPMIIRRKGGCRYD